VNALPEDEHLGLFSSRPACSPSNSDSALILLIVVAMPVLGNPGQLGFLAGELKAELQLLPFVFSFMPGLFVLLRLLHCLS
jgi:hypothetical protein